MNVVSDIISLVMSVYPVRDLTDLEEDADGGGHSHHSHSDHRHLVRGPCRLFLTHVRNEFLLCGGHLQLQGTESHRSLWLLNPSFICF